MSHSAVVVVVVERRGIVVDVLVDGGIVDVEVELVDVDVLVVFGIVVVVVVEVDEVDVDVLVDVVDVDAEVVDVDDEEVDDVLVEVDVDEVDVLDSTTVVNVAVTVWSWSMVRLHGPGPVQSPLQPANVEPASAVAVRVTGVPCGNVVAQVAPQSMPDGELDTDPVPVPDFATFRLCVGTPTRPSASMARLVAPMIDPSSRRSAGHEPSAPC